MKLSHAQYDYIILSYKENNLYMIILIYHNNMDSYHRNFRGKKITCPGARDKLNFRQDKHIFSPNVRRTSKKLSASIFFLDTDKLFGNRTSKNFDVLVRRTSEIF